MDLENDPIYTEAAETWCQDGLIWIAVYNEPIMKGYVRLPDALVDAWESVEEIGEALELAFPLAYGPHPAIEGVPEPERRWIGVNAFDVQAQLVREHGEVPTDIVARRIHAELMTLAVCLVQADEFAKQGMSVKPARPTWTHEDVMKVAAVTGHERSRAVIEIGRGESAWYPRMGYYSFKGPGTIVYEFTGERVKAHRVRV
jgi:hypothetical protein